MSVIFDICLWKYIQCVVNYCLLDFIGTMLGGVPVPTAWRILGLRMEERPPDMEVSCEYIE
jgi:hypothetical protein